MKTIRFDKEKNIGRVLFIVEGDRTEFYLLRKIFTNIFNYQVEELGRKGIKSYRKYNAKEGILSSVFVINSEHSALKHIDDDNDFLNNMFETLIEKGFPVDRAAIFYIFDRDGRSNTDRQHIINLIHSLTSSRDSNGFSRQGLFLLSYPCIESYVASGFLSNSFQIGFEKGAELKQFLAKENLNPQKIGEENLLHAVKEMDMALRQIGVSEYLDHLDNFAPINERVFRFQEQFHDKNQTYKLLSLLCIALWDLGMITIE